jgi:hypothetical protein
VADLGKTKRVIEVTPLEQPVPIETPAPLPAPVEEPEKVPASAS